MVCLTVVLLIFILYFVSDNTEKIEKILNYFKETPYSNSQHDNLKQLSDFFKNHPQFFSQFVNHLLSVFSSVQQKQDDSNGLREQFVFTLTCFTLAHSDLLGNDNSQLLSLCHHLIRTLHTHVKSLSEHLAKIQFSHFHLQLRLLFQTVCYVSR